MQSQSYVVRLPIHNKNSELCAYEILYVEDGGYDSVGGDAAAAKAIEVLLMQFQNDGLLDGKAAFVDFTHKLLVRKVPEMFNSEKLIIQIDQEMLLDSEAMRMVQQYREMGYQVALKGFEFNARSISALDHIDMLKINFEYMDVEKKSVIDIAKKLQKKVVLYSVNTEKAYHVARALDVDYVQGLYIGMQMPKKAGIVKPHQGNFFKLMVEVTKEEPDFNEIESLISMDVTLTYALLKLVNSAYFAMRKRVESVHQALVVLGIAQLRQWIYVLSFESDEGELPSEFIKISFLRASMCSELLAYAQDVPLNKSEAYLMGMFSTIDSLMEISLEEALQELNISPYIVEALTKQEGRAGLLYRLVLDYEKGNWISMANCAERLGIEEDIIAEKYFSCMNLVDQMWKSFTEMRNDGE